VAIFLSDIVGFTNISSQLGLFCLFIRSLFVFVTIFLSDIVGFTDISSQLDPLKVSQMLHRLYTTFDALSNEHKVFKVETIGDAYMAVTNLVADQELNPKP
jgi:class 3 adenylate cyclase